MSEDPTLKNKQEVVAAEVAAEGEQIPATSEDQKVVTAKSSETTQPKKRGRKPKVVVPVPSNEVQNQGEEIKPKIDGEETEIKEAPQTIKNETNEEDDEEYGGGDESDDDYNGNTYQKKKISKNSSIKKSTGAKRGRKPKSQAQKDAELAEKQAALAAASTSQIESNDAAKESEGTPANSLLPNGKRVTRTSSGRLPSHHEVYQPTFKKYKPTKKEGEANNQPSEDSLAKDQQPTETNGKTESNNGNDDASVQQAMAEGSVNAKRAHSAIEGTSPTNILTQAELPEEHHPEKKLKTDSP